MGEKTLSVSGTGIRIRHFVAALATTTILLLGMATNASAVSIGMAWGNYDPALTETTARSGATVYRMDLNYTCSRPDNGWDKFTAVVEAAWKRGITILPILMRTTPQCEGGNGQTRFLTDKDPDWAKWKTWTEAAVQRFGVNGSFWAGKINPTPINAWEVWNEPNLKANNPIIGGVEATQPAEYGKFLKYTSDAIRAASPQGVNPQILFAGMLMIGELDYKNFVKTATTAAGTNAYTALSIHPYPFFEGLTELQRQVNGARALLDNEITGGKSKSMWITEMGWATGGDNFPTRNVFDAKGKVIGTQQAVAVTESQQATLLTEGFNWLKGVAAGDQIPLITWYSIRDYNSAPEDAWAQWTGVTRENGTYKPAWYAFQAQTGTAPWPTFNPEELGFIRFKTMNTHLDSYITGPTYKTLASNSDTGYPKIPDPQNVRSLALDTNSDGIDELGFLRVNPSGANMHLDTYTGAPNYKTLAGNCDVGYPKVSDPQNVQVLPIDSYRTTGDELGFVRFNASSGQTHLDTYGGGPCYGSPISISDTGYPAIPDAQNVRALALDIDGNGIDELGFLRVNPGGTNNMHLDLYTGAPDYKDLASNCDVGYPKVSDPQNVQVMALDINGDGIDELGFLRLKPLTLNAHLDVYASSGLPACYTTLASSSDVGYPKVSDPENIQALAINSTALPYDPPPYWTFDSIGGSVTSDPDISSWGPGRLDVFAKSSTGTLAHRAFSATTWLGWDTVPNSAGLTSGPGAVSWGTGRIDAVARVGKEAVQHWWFDVGSGSWNSDALAGNIASDPDISSWGPGRLDVFAKGTDGWLAHKAFSSTAWFPWENVPGSSGLGSGPGAVSWGTGRIDMVAQDAATGQVRHFWFDNGTGLWQSETPWAVKSGSDPDISSWGPGRLDVFAKGPENGLIHKYWNGSSWSGWESLGGPPLASGPAAVSWAKDRIDVVAKAADGSLNHWWYTDP